jgi:hypothetical protein
MYTNITVADRLFRIAISLGLVLAVLSMSGPVGSLVYALFVSIYLGITAFIGWDPVNALLNPSPSPQEKPAAKQGYHHGRLATR